MFSHYRPSESELWISNKYQENAIFSPSDLVIERVAELFGYLIKGTYEDSGAVFDDDGDCIIYLKYQAEAQRRADFFHELCHPLRHVGDQSKLPALFVDLQEAQAAQFQLYAAMPFYMVREYPPRQSWDEYYQMLANEFMLPLQLVKRRINQILNCIKQAKWDRQYRNTLLPASYWIPPPKVIDEPPEIALLYDYHDSISPSSLVIKGAGEVLDWSQPAYIPIPQNVDRMEPDDFEELVTATVPGDYILQREDKPDQVGIHLPYLGSYLGTTDIDQLLIRLYELNFDIRQGLLRTSNF
ncbi:ImmA/IrrE family metallo-endopeptidase [Paenibacillus sp. GCM10027626]|uniref:ImmA/IrrE family metallo-endopeptidase n=1 Tax=Paenibacillus sp. GCM10027626 TaxID=3273411 RepID=UPI0036360D02